MKGIFRSSWMAMIRKTIAVIVIAAFSLSPSTTYAQTMLDLPAPGAMVLQSPAFVPVVLRAVKIRPDEPLVFDFVVDNGNTGFEGEALKREIEKIAKYFLATLTIPQKDLWVNLSPYEKDRIIADEFGQTEMGRDMLAQDYILKQLSSSLVNPDTALGKEYWAKLYAKAQEVLGTTEIPMDTFNKVWIVPEKAVIYEKDNAAILGETHLKLMMEEDYVAMKNGTASTDWAQRISQQVSDPNRAAAQVSAQIMREVILPEIEKEVNTGKNFAPLRQMFSAIILATWYKEAVKDSLLSQMYEDKKKIAGVDIQDVNMREKIFDQYVAAYKKGVFDFIRDDQDPVSGDVLPRRYFSGGVNAENVQKAMSRQKLAAVPASLDSGNFGAEDRTYSSAMIALTKPGEKPRAPEMAMTKAEVIQNLVQAEREYRAADAQVRALGNASGPDRAAGETARMLAENKLLVNSRQLLKLGGLLGVDVLGRELSDLVASVRFKYQEGDASLHHEGIPPGNNFRAEAAMAIDPTLKRSLIASPLLPVNVKTMLGADQIDQSQGERLLFLVKHKQMLLLSKIARQTSEQVISVLNHLTLKEAYPGGLVQYFVNLVRALVNKAKGITMFSDLEIVRQPEEGKDYIDYTKGGTKLQDAFKNGLKKVPGLAFAKVAGGAGKRLGSERAKAALEVDPVTHRTFLQLDCEAIQALQRESNRENKIKDTKIHLFIMVSDETVHDTLLLLNDNSSFGLEGHILLDLNRHHIVAQGGKKMLFDKVTNQYTDLPQIVIVKQESVPEVVVLAPVKNSETGEMEPEIQLDTDKNDGILTRSALKDEMPYGGEVFDLLMANGSFEETKGVEGHVKELPPNVDDLKALIARHYPAVEGARVIAILKEAHDRSRVAQAGHGHQDVHILMNQSGFAEAHLATGGTSTIVMQDTNEALRRLELPTSLLAELKDDVTVNTTTIFRNPRERTGAYGVFKAPDGREVMLNIEYTVLPKVAASLGRTEANFQLGNINYIAFRQDAYVAFLKKTGGVTPEFAAPKLDKGRPGDNHLRGRAEGNFQDALKEMPGRTVASLFSKHYAFLTTKNNVEETMTFVAQALQDGRTMAETMDMDLEHRGWSDSMDSALNQELLVQAGVKMPARTMRFLYEGKYRSQYYNVGPTGAVRPVLYVEGITDPAAKPNGPLMADIPFEGIPYSEGITLKFSPSFATTDADIVLGRLDESIPPKVSCGDILSGAVVALDGEGLFLNNTSIAGAVILKVEDGAKATFSGVKIQNKGWEKVLLSLAQSQDKVKFSETARMHGYAYDDGGYYYKAAQTTRVRVIKGEVMIGAGSSGILSQDVSVTITNNSKKPFNLDDQRDTLSAYFTSQGQGKPVKNVHVTVDQGGAVSINDMVAESVPAVAPVTEQKPTDGGIDFYNAVESMKIERTGKGIKVHVDPAMIQRIQTGGFDGLAPVVIEVIPVRGILPALGMADARGSGTT